MMLSLRFYTITSTQMFRKATIGTGNPIRSSSSNVTAIDLSVVSSRRSESIDGKPGKDNQDVSSHEAENFKKDKNSLVAAAFKNLNNSAPTHIANDNISERINNAKTINGLLSVAESNTSLSRQHALRVVSILAEWSDKDRVKLNEFENDSRFLKVCRMLGRTVQSNNNVTKEDRSKPISGFRTDDLNTVLGIAGDDEAAKLIGSISLPQMVKVMSTLAARKRRSTPLLRSLAFNISSATESLDLKQCADIFFAMASLNFQDSVLAAKVCADIQVTLHKNSGKSAVVGSLLTSLGILKYRDLDILETLTQWVLQHNEICRPQDLSALFLTSAILNFKSINIEDIRKKLVKSIVQQDFNKNVDWLNHVWALTMLGFCDNKQLETVLAQTFVENLQLDRHGFTATSKMKLLNLSSYAQLIATDYKGPVIEKDSEVYDVLMTHQKSKQVLVNGLNDALKSLLPSKNHIKILVDSKMGFLIDALCAFDSKRNPLPLDKVHPNGIKIALMVVDYHDICHGTHKSASGVTCLNFNLLEKSGYKVMPVPYNEFNTSDKLLKRVQYLESKFKALISTNTKLTK